MILRFRSGSVTFFEAGEKWLGAVENPQIQMQLLAAKVFLHLISLAGPQDAVIDENAGQLIADGSMGERRRDRRIHAAAQRADDSFLADLFANLLHCRLDIRLHRPGRLAAANFVDEIAKNTSPLPAYARLPDGTADNRSRRL